MGDKNDVYQIVGATRPQRAVDPDSGMSRAQATSEAPSPGLATVLFSNEVPGIFVKLPTLGGAQRLLRPCPVEAERCMASGRLMEDTFVASSSPSSLTSSSSTSGQKSIDDHPKKPFPFASRPNFRSGIAPPRRRTIHRICGPRGACLGRKTTSMQGTRKHP